MTNSREKDNNLILRNFLIPKKRGPDRQITLHAQTTSNQHFRVLKNERVTNDHQTFEEKT